VYGIVSQCIDTKNIKKVPDDYFESFLLKVNAKLGGQNTVFDESAVKTFPFHCDRTMIVGVDVQSPYGAFLKVQSNISALVGSYDNLFTKYSASIRVQQKNSLIIPNIESMLDELLGEYYRYNNRYPENVILFRRGISNSNFLYFRRSEIGQMQNSIFKTRKNINLTVIVIQRKTQVRFATPSLPKIGSIVQNPVVPSGTVVDQYVVDPLSREFYLVSQSNEHVSGRNIFSLKLLIFPF